MKTTTYLEHYIQTNIEPTSENVCEGDLVIYNDLSYSHLYIGYNHIASGYGFASSDARNDIIEYATYSYNYVTNLNLDSTPGESSTIITYENNVTIDEGKNTVSFGVGSYTLSKTEDNVIYVDSKIKPTILNSYIYDQNDKLITFTNPQFVNYDYNIKYITFDYIGSDKIDNFWITYNSDISLYGSKQNMLSFESNEYFTITYKELVDSEINNEEIYYRKYYLWIKEDLFSDLCKKSGQLSTNIHLFINNKEIKDNLFITYLIKPIYSSYSETSSEIEFDNNRSHKLTDLSNYPFTSFKTGVEEEINYGVIFTPSDYELTFYLKDSNIKTPWVQINESANISNEKYNIYVTPQKYIGITYWNIKFENINI
jgi:hypothetical protein